MTAQILSGAVIGVVVAVVSTLVSHLLILRRERARWEREDRRQREAWERDTQLKHRDDRVALYRSFLADVDAMGSVWGPRDERRATYQRAFKGVAEIKLLGSREVHGAAHELFLAASKVSRLEEDIVEDERSEDHEGAERNREDMRKALRELATRHIAFVSAVRKELGVDVARSTLG